MRRMCAKKMEQEQRGEESGKRKRLVSFHSYQPECTSVCFASPVDKRQNKWQVLGRDVVPNKSTFGRRQGEVLVAAALGEWKVESQSKKASRPELFYSVSAQGEWGVVKRPNEGGAKGVPNGEESGGKEAGLRSTDRRSRCTIRTINKLFRAKFSGFHLIKKSSWLHYGAEGQKQERFPRIEYSAITLRIERTEILWQEHATVTHVNSLLEAFSKEALSRWLLVEKNLYPMHFRYHVTTTSYWQPVLSHSYTEKSVIRNSLRASLYCFFALLETHFLLLQPPMNRTTFSNFKSSKGASCTRRERVSDGLTWLLVTTSCSSAAETRNIFMWL